MAPDPESFKSDPDKSFILNYAPIFAELSQPEKDLIFKKAKVVEYKKGDTIYKQSDPADAFYCLISGRVRIHAAQKTLEYLNCGKYFGIISLLTGEPHSVYAQAVNDSKVLRVAKEEFQEILHSIPKLAIDLSRTLSRRLRKKEGEKKIFESNIISVFSAAAGLGRTTYATNLALSLKKETSKNVILIDVSEEACQICRALEIGEGPKALDLNTLLPTDDTIKGAIIDLARQGLSILNVRHKSAEVSYASSLNALLTYLTGSYHYVIVDLPALFDAFTFQALNQADLIHIITDYDTYNLDKTKALILDLFQKVNYPQDKIKVIINIKQEGLELSNEEASRLLNYKIYATLPQLEAGMRASRAVLENPNTDYARVIRRIAREIGNVRVGLALSGGAAFGLAHIGVIKVLEKENIPIDMVAAASMGAFVGAFWALGTNAKQMVREINSKYNTKKKVFNFLMDLCFPKLSFAKGKKIRAFLKKYLGERTFQDVRFPFKIIACNISKRQEVIYDTGSLVDAVMASIAIPGIFAPTRINGDLIVDGGIIESVPIGVLVRAGIKKIIAVNVLPSPEDIASSYEFNLRLKDEERKKAEAKGFLSKIIYNLGMRLNNLFFPNIFDVIVNSIQVMEYVIAESECQKADVVINPIVTGVDWFEFFKVDELVKKGEEETRKALATIKNLVNE